jgi:hypothetical protein
MEGRLGPLERLFRTDEAGTGTETSGLPGGLGARHVRLRQPRPIPPFSRGQDPVGSKRRGPSLLEISENLHRVELTVLEHDLQLARWI